MFHLSQPSQGHRAYTNSTPSFLYQALAPLKKLLSSSAPIRIFTKSKISEELLQREKTLSPKRNVLRFTKIVVFILKGLGPDYDRLVSNDCN